MKKNTDLLIHLKDKVSERRISAVYLKIAMTKDETVAAAITFQNSVSMVNHVLCFGV